MNAGATIGRMRAATVALTIGVTFALLAPFAHAMPIGGGGPAAASTRTVFSADARRSGASVTAVPNLFQVLRNDRY